MRTLFSYVAERGDADWVVDSSKSGRHAAGRFWALRNVADLDIQVIHLVRDGRDVLNSVVEKGTNWAAEEFRKEKTFRAERAIVGWVLANGLAWTLGLGLDEDRYLRVRFEDLLSQPESVLQRIGAFMGEDLSHVIDRVSAGGSFSVGHNVGGNRLRKKERILLRRKENVRRQPWKGLSPYHRSLFGLLGQWLNQSFGYTI